MLHVGMFECLCFEIKATMNILIKKVLLHDMGSWVDMFANNKAYLYCQ